MYSNVMLYSMERKEHNTGLRVVFQNVGTLSCENASALWKVREERDTNGKRGRWIDYAKINLAMLFGLNMASQGQM